ncbi:MAG: hypothetical protein ABJN69_03505 [Hellea sp.]
MKMRAIVFAGLLVSAPAFADDKAEAPALRERINCFPAKNITKMVKKFQKIDADKRDTVDMIFDAKFKANDGGVLPERIFMREAGAEENFTLNADGGVPDFGRIGSVSEDAKLCSEDPSREGTPRGEGLNFSINSNVYFLESTGYHDMATIKDGLKDGKTHYKKMVPGPMRMLVPKLTYVMIEYDEEKTTPQFTAMKGQAPIDGLDHVIFCNSAMINIKDMEALGADGLKVMGGAYNLTPVPGPKTLAKFTGCEGEDGETPDK